MREGLLSCAFIGAATLLLSSCTYFDSYSQSAMSGQSEVVSQFTGPYGPELAQAYRDSESEYFREAVRDGTITDSEYFEAQNRSRQCLEENGFTGIVMNPDGTGSIDARTDISEEEESRLKVDCDTKSGLIDTEIWYRSLKANPENVDWPSAERDCLVRAGLLEAGATVEEMNEWYMSGDPASQSRAAYVCSQDALGHLSLQ